MKEFNLPVPELTESDSADITVFIKGKEMKHEFRIEAFSWETGNEFSSVTDPLVKSLARIYNLKYAIENYDNNWELIQIFNPENSQYIHALFRKKSIIK